MSFDVFLTLSRALHSMRMRQERAVKRQISTTGVIFVALGVVGVIAALVSLSRSVDERAGQFTPSRELSEAVADPDNGSPPYLRAHVR
jgi:hypothetical protein